MAYRAMLLLFISRGLALGAARLQAWPRLLRSILMPLGPSARAFTLGILLLAGCSTVSPVIVGPAPFEPPTEAHAVAPAPPPPCPGPGCLGWSTLLLSGGRDRSQNAIAHERNLLFAMRTLTASGIEPASQTLFFADGDSPEPDVQIEEPDVAQRRRLLAIGLLRYADERSTEATLRYRDHSLPGAEPATQDRFLKQLSADAERATERFAAAQTEVPGDEPAARPSDLFMYVTDHGLKRADLSNNVIVMWGKRDLNVRDLGAALDAQPQQRRVVTVMAQCFSGSFAALVHEGGNPMRPVAPHDRCGFFAAPADRPAAGCSPKSDEMLYDDYTTRFFAALGGRDRVGAVTPSADTDGDGRVSFEEAHYAAVALERTQDVPVTTSEELLRRRRPQWLREAAMDTRPIAQILDDARPAMRAAAAALFRALELRDDANVADLVSQLAQHRAFCWPGLCEADDALHRARRAAHGAILRAARGTMLPPTPQAALVLATVGRERIDDWIAAAQPSFDEVIRLEVEVDRLRIEAETREGQLERLKRLVELHIAEKRLEAENGELTAAYQRIRTCEASGLWERKMSFDEKEEPSMP